MSAGHAINPRRRWMVTMAMLAAMAAWGVATEGPAHAAAPNAVLCSGYATCSQNPFTTHGYPSHAGTSYWKMYAGNTCTNYVAYVESSAFNAPAPGYSLGNAGQWAANAAAHGVLVNHTPSAGAVAVWFGGNPGIGSSGHVAVVEAVGPNLSYITISQQHMMAPDGYDWVRVYPNASENQWEQWPDAFIHFIPGPSTLTASPPTPPVVAPSKNSAVMLRVQLASTK